MDHVNVFYIYHSEHYGLSFLDLTDAIFYKVSFFLYTFPFLQVHFVVVPYVGAVVAVTVMCVLLFVLHVCMLRECEGAMVKAMLVWGMERV